MNGETAIQEHLFSPAEEADFLLPKEELYRKHSGRTAAAIEERREAIIMLLGRFYPVSEIEARLHVGRHTIKALGAMCAQQISGDMKKLAHWMLGLSADWLMKAHLKSEDAQFKDLSTGASYIAQRALETLGTVEAQDLGEALDVETGPSETASRVLAWVREGEKEEGIQKTEARSQETEDRSQKVEGVKP
jgi:hypothetical protein